MLSIFAMYWITSQQSPKAVEKPAKWVDVWAKLQHTSNEDHGRSTLETSLLGGLNRMITKIR